MKSSTVDWIDGTSIHSIPLYGTESHSTHFSLGFTAQWKMIGCIGKAWDMGEFGPSCMLLWGVCNWKLRKKICEKTMTHISCSHYNIIWESLVGCSTKWLPKDVNESCYAKTRGQTMYREMAQVRDPVTIQILNKWVSSIITMNGNMVGVRGAGCRRIHCSQKSLDTTRGWGLVILLAKRLITFYTLWHWPLALHWTAISDIVATRS